MNELNRLLAKSMLGLFDIPVSILERYNEPHRFYHNWEHIDYLLSKYREMDIKIAEDSYCMFLAIIFHDIVYDPKSSTNEEDSVKYFEEHYYGCTFSIREQVVRMILDTKIHKGSNELSQTFCDMDMDILNQPLSKLIEYENKIFKEFQYVPYQDYKEARVNFLISQVDKYPNLKDLVYYVESRVPKIGIYAGSFNPFHIGHLKVLEAAEKIFDKVVIAQGINIEKVSSTDNFDFNSLPFSLRFRQIEQYTGLFTDFLKERFEGMDVTLIRGLRNSTDLQYEYNKNRFLKDLDPTIKSVSILCDPEYAHISSSDIRSLQKYGKGKEYLV